MLITMARDLIDPRTRQATAFYAAVAVAVYDVVKHGGGFNIWNTLVLASAAGLGAAVALAQIIKPGGKSTPNP